MLDVNALVAPGFLHHEFHERVAAWVRASVAKGTVELATCSTKEHLQGVQRQRQVCRILVIVRLGLSQVKG